MLRCDLFRALMTRASHFTSLFDGCSELPSKLCVTQPQTRDKLIPFISLWYDRSQGSNLWPSTLGATPIQQANETKQVPLFYISNSYIQDIKIQ